MSSASGMTDAVSSDARKRPKKEEQDRDDEQRTFDEVPKHRARRALDDLALAVEGTDSDARRAAPA